VILADHPLRNQILKMDCDDYRHREANATASAENSSSPFELLFRLACDGLPHLWRWSCRKSARQADRQVVYVLLKERQPYREPDPKHMHELEKAKLVRHHAKRLRQLGADDDLVNELVARLNHPTVYSSVEKSETTTQLPPQPIRKASPAKVCRGALGFRARQTRKHEYSVTDRRAAETHSATHAEGKRKKEPETNDQSWSEVRSRKDIFEATGLT
jgi:hypothetical protein